MKQLTPYHRCPNCGSDEYGPFNYLAVYPSIQQEKEMIDDGIPIKYRFIAKSSPESNGCCDFGNKYSTREDAEAYINWCSSMEDVFNDFYEPYDDSYDDYFEQGPPDSDPYDAVKISQIELHINTDAINIDSNGEKIDRIDFHEISGLVEPFGGSHAPDCPYRLGGECLCWRSDPEQNPEILEDT